jgi:hypothetical protein
VFCIIRKTNSSGIAKPTKHFVCKLFEISEQTAEVDSDIFHLTASHRRIFTERNFVKVCLLGTSQRLRSKNCANKFQTLSLNRVTRQGPVDGIYYSLAVDKMK